MKFLFLLVFLLSFNSFGKEKIIPLKMDPGHWVFNFVFSEEVANGFFGGMPDGPQKQQMMEMIKAQFKKKAKPQNICMLEEMIKNPQLALNSLNRIADQQKCQKKIIASTPEKFEMSMVCDKDGGKQNIHVSLNRVTNKKYVGFASGLSTQMLGKINFEYVMVTDKCSRNLIEKSKQWVKGD